VRGWVRLSYWLLVLCFAGMGVLLIGESARETTLENIGLTLLCLACVVWGTLQLLVEWAVIDAEQLTKRDMLGRVRSYPHRDIQHVMQMSGVQILYRDGRSVRLAAVSCSPAAVVAFLNKVRTPPT
jgi:hypothetical protein